MQNGCQEAQMQLNGETIEGPQFATAKETKDTLAGTVTKPNARLAASVTIRTTLQKCVKQCEKNMHTVNGENRQEVFRIQT